MSVLGHHDVLGLQIPVHDPGGVRLRQAFGDLRSDPQKLTNRQGSTRQLRPQGLALHELHCDVGDAAVGTDLVDRDDVGMVQGRG